MNDTTTTTYVSGDWEWNETIGGYEVAYAVIDINRTWNGFAVPVFDRGTMAAFCARQAWLFHRDDFAEWETWQMLEDGRVQVIRSDEDAEDEFITPNEDDCYLVEGLTFQKLDEDDNVLHRVG